MAQLGTGRYLECRMHTYMHMHIRFISIYLAQYYFAYMCCRCISLLSLGTSEPANAHAASLIYISTRDLQPPYG